jgi:hypothetical protein
MKKTSSTPNLPASSRLQPPGGSDKTSTMTDKSAMKGKSGATKKMMGGATKKGMASKKKY